MDKENLKISVFTSQPNNGYVAMVFFENKLAISSECKQSDLYKGLLELCSEVILDTVEEDRPKGDSEKIDSYASALTKARLDFYHMLDRCISIETTARQLIERGMSYEEARALAEMFVTARDKSEFPNDDSEEADEE